MIALAAGLTLASGCGDGRPKRSAVSGIVTDHGQPIEGASVTFIPKGARPATGATDAQGRFTLQTFTAGDGAVTGEHIVCVTKSMPDANDQGKSPYPKMISVLPARYATPLQSPLKATVADRGPNEFHFDLTD